MGECKFKHQRFRYSEYLNTVAKLTPQKQKAAFYYALFSESGFDEKIEELARKDQTLRLYNLAEIVSYRDGGCKIITVFEKVNK